MDDNISGTNCAVSFIRCYGEVYDVASQHGVVSDLVLVCVGESGDPGEGGREGRREGGRGGGRGDDCFTYRIQCIYALVYVCMYIV